MKQTEFLFQKWGASRLRKIARQAAYYLWYKTAVPIFIERYLLPLLATATFVLIILNPMKFDRTQQVTLAVAVITFAYFLAHTLHKYNQEARKSEQKSASAQPSESPPAPVPSSQVHVLPTPKAWPSLTGELAEANAEFRTIYNRLLSTTRETLNEYQKKGTANLYIAIPDLPVNLFSAEAHSYNGGATFSRYASWNFFIRNAELDTPLNTATLELVLMNGDGHTVSASEIGQVRFQYDPKTKTMNILSKGVGQTAIGKAEQKMSVSDFKRAVPAIVKSLIEYQLDHL